MTTPLPGYLTDAGHWIGGEVSPGTGDPIPVLNPATGAEQASSARGTTADIDAAVSAAKAAFPGWSSTPARERARILVRAAALIHERGDELAAIESVDVGKPVSLARAVDVTTAAATYEYAASLVPLLDGAARQVAVPAHAYTRREPLGVVAAITPFNFPLILTTSKVAIALLAGNSVVHKPAEDTPLSALFMARLLADAGLPPGVLNVVTGYGAELGDHLVTHPDVAKVAFTGSTTVGSHVAGLAGRALRPLTAELGGNAANIVFADADIEKAVGTTISAFVFNTGQFCMAGPRLLVERPVLEPMLEALAGALPHVPFGDPADPATVIGPLASRKQLDKVAGMVDAARDGGARVVTGGERAAGDGFGDGFFYRPTVLADVTSDTEAVREEVFGPVLTVQAFDSEAEAIALANSTPYGLAAGLQTESISRAHRVAAALDAGIVWVNGWGLLDPAMPFGGVKSSGWGRENGPEQLDAYTRTKSVIIGLDPAD